MSEVHENLFRVDDMRPVLAAIRERGIQVDPMFPGECRQLFGNVGVRLRYCRKAGLNIDAVAELLYDRGYTARRISTVECIDVLDRLLTGAPAKVQSTPSSRQLEIEASRARANRMRKFVCDCGQIARGTRNSSLICGVCFEMTGEIHVMRRVDPLPEEILARAA